MSYKQVSRGFLPTWKPTKVGDEIEGFYTAKKDNQGKNKNSTQYTLLTKDGDIDVWGSVVLDRNFGAIPLGVKVKIIYQGKTTTKSGNDVNQYDFFYDEDEKIPIDDVKEPADTPPDFGEGEYPDEPPDLEDEPN